MAKKIKDTEYAFLSSLVRSMENRLLTQEDVDRMLASRTTEGAARVLEDRGYAGLAGLDAVALEARLSANRSEAYAELEEYSPDPDIVRVFRIRYDYHNAKVILKSAALGTDSSAYLSAAGRYDPELMEAYIARGEEVELPAAFLALLDSARDSLASTADPQIMDFILDKAYFEEMLAAAQATGSSFLKAYVQALIDSANLRTAVRALRQKKEPIALSRLLFEGGIVPAEDILNGLISGTGIEDLFRNTAFEAAAAAGAASIEGGRITEFERQCDNAVTAVCSAADLIGFGEQPIIAYLHALDTDITAVRIVMTGLAAGLDTELIRERLRELK